MTATFVMLGALTCVAIGVSPLASTITVDPGGARAKAMRRAERQFGAAISLACLCGLLAMWTLAQSGQPWWPVFAALALLVPVVNPWMLAHYVLIPLGATRGAYWLSRTGGHPWFRDPVGGAVLAGVLATLRWRNPKHHRLEWLRVRLGEDNLGGAGIVALGLLAAANADRERARLLLHSLDEIDPDICPPLARVIALDWLVADAARRGAWHEVLDLVGEDPFSSATTHLVETCARRMLGEPVSRRTILRRWLGAPRPWHTAGLVWRACIQALANSDQSTVIPETDLAKVAANGGPEPLSMVLGLHAEAGGIAPSAPVPWFVIARLAAAWDAALGDFTVRGLVRTRAAELGIGTSGELLVARLQRGIGPDLMELSSRCREDADRLPMDLGILRRAREFRTEAVLAEVGTACQRLQRDRLAHANAMLTWTHWAELRWVYMDGVMPLSKSQRMWVFRLFEEEVRDTAVWLSQSSKQRGLAHAMCLCLLREAEFVADPAAANYYRHAVAAGV